MVTMMTMMMIQKKKTSVSQHPNFRWHIKWIDTVWYMYACLALYYNFCLTGPLKPCIEWGLESGVRATLHTTKYSEWQLACSSKVESWQRRMRGNDHSAHRSLASDIPPAAPKKTARVHLNLPPHRTAALPLLPPRLHPQADVIAALMWTQLAGSNPQHTLNLEAFCVLKNCENWFLLTLESLCHQALLHWANWRGGLLLLTLQWIIVVIVICQAGYVFIACLSSSKW